MQGRSALEDRAARLLEELGFQEYEARCLVALLEHTSATAAEVSKTAGIPRSRVYDVADSLAERNLIEVQEGEPRRYRVVSAETVVDYIESEYRDRVDELSELLDSLEEATAANTRPGVWQLSGEGTILSRLREFVTRAEEELVVVVTGELLTEEYVETLEGVADGGVDLTFVTHDPDLRTWLGDRFPDARVTETPSIWRGMSGDSDIAHVAFVDWSAVMMVATTRATPTSSPRFNATLIEGVECGFILTLRELLREALEPQAAN